MPPSQFSGLPCLTIWQPWATLVMEGHKQIEFREWPTPPDLVGQNMGVHAGKRPVHREEISGLIYKLERGGDEARSTGLINWEECNRLLHRWRASPKSLPFSSLLGTVKITECLRNQLLAERLGLEFVNDSDRYQHSNYGWCLTDPKHFRPLIGPVPGKLGIWHWTGSAHSVRV